MLQKHLSGTMPSPLMSIGRLPRRIAFFCAVLAFITASASAQCDYRSNGAFFLHPFFRNADWQASLFPSFIDNTPLCETRPVQISICGAPAQGTAVYTDSDGDWYLSNGPLVNDNCICCQPEIIFGEPFGIAIPASLSLQTTAPFHVLCRSTSYNDTVYLVASSTKKVYSLHIDVTSGKIGRIDSLPVTLPETQTITGVWGDPGANGIDTAIWISGTGGCLVQFPFNGNSFRSERSFTIDESETVQCIGSGYAGTASGKIFRRNGAAFTLDASVGSSALRSISNLIAVGDAGTVIVRENNAWQLYKTASANYRHGNLTANASGTAVELLDESWNYSSIALFNTPTSITGVLPSDAASGLNSGVYTYDDYSVKTITIKLGDPDNNRSLPTIRLKGSTNKIIADSTTLLRQNPAAICTTAQSLFNDSIVKIILDVKTVDILASARKGAKNASCPLLWKWQSFTMTKSEPWAFEDSLIITLGKDTMRIFNTTLTTVLTDATRSGNGRRNSPFTLVFSHGHLRITPNPQSRLCRISIISPSGRVIWKKAVAISSTAALSSPAIPPGIHFLRADYADGSPEIRRIVITGK
jgi:hypothetical protein